MSQRCAIDDERGGLLDELTTAFEALMLKAEELTNTNNHLLDCVKHFQEVRGICAASLSPNTL